MKVHITLTAGRGGGKTHLARALRDFFTEDYPNAGPLAVTIIERLPEDSPEGVITGTAFGIAASAYEKPSTADYTGEGYYWFKAERASTRSIAQLVKGQWFLVNEKGPVTLADLMMRGWHIDEKVK